MSNIEHADTPDVLGEGKFLRLVSDNTWEYASRKRGSDVVGIIAITDDDKLILIEQYRPAVRATVVEIPAGLVGDEQSDEPVETAAARELEEETGYTCETMQAVMRGASTAGMCDEQVLMLRARGLKKVSSGGGVESENIVTHAVALAEVPAFLKSASDRGLAVDFKVWSALGLIAAGWA